MIESSAVLPALIGAAPLELGTPAELIAILETTAVNGVHRAEY
jgi:hypothetical protein